MLDNFIRGFTIFCFPQPQSSISHWDLSDITKWFFRVQLLTYATNLTGNCIRHINICLLTSRGFSSQRIHNVKKLESARSTLRVSRIFLIPVFLYCEQEKAISDCYQWFVILETSAVARLWVAHDHGQCLTESHSACNVRIFSCAQRKALPRSAECVLQLYRSRTS